MEEINMSANGCYAKQQQCLATQTAKARQYHWIGGSEAIFTSMENWVGTGTPRVIGEQIFWAYAVDRHWWGKNRVCWYCPHLKYSEEIIRQAIMGDYDDMAQERE